MSMQNAATQKQNLSCVATAPTRVDLAGGTLDVWPLAAILQEKYELWNQPVVTVNVAINLRARAELTLEKSAEFAWSFTDAMNSRTARGHSLESVGAASEFVLHRAVTRFYCEMLKAHGHGHVTLCSNAQAPKGSGLGGSSSLVVAMLAAFDALLQRVSSAGGTGGGGGAGHTPHSAPWVTPACDKNRLCLRAQNLEAGVLGNLAGNQDHFAAAYGGVQEVLHCADGTTSRPIACDGSTLLNHLVLAYSGQQHFSAFNNWLVLEQALTGKANLLAKCADIARLAHALPPLLVSSDWRGMAALMAREWEIRRTLAEGISTPQLDAMYTAALKAGAAGGKVCGAGGGGVLVMVMDDPGARARIEQAIEGVGGLLLKTQFSASGVELSLT